MAATRWAGLTNPATWYLATGLVLLGASIWVPFATAQRTTRVEGRADSIALTMIETIAAWPDALAATDMDVVLARFRAQAERDRIYLEDLEVIEPPWSGTLLSLANKHYLFHVAVSPPEPNAERTPQSLPSYEVMAWPRYSNGPAHSVFFHADNATATYTRNLGQGYEASGRNRPVPGCAHRREALWEWTKSYYGHDDQRWIAYRGWTPDS